MLCHEWNWKFRTHVSVIGTDCIGSCKSNYHTITTTPDCIYKYIVHVSLATCTLYITCLQSLRPLMHKKYIEAKTPDILIFFNK
jgi:hypothetical protein